MKKLLGIFFASAIRVQLYSAESEIVLKSSIFYLLLIITAAALIVAIKYYITGNKNKRLFNKLQEDIQKSQNDKQLAMQEAIRKEKELNQIIEHAPIGIAIRDFSGKLISINSTYANILGYSQEELMAGKFEEVGYEEDVEKSEKEYQKLLEGKESAHIDKRLIKSDGSIIYVSQNLVLIRNLNNEPTLLVGMTVDITKRVKAMQELLESKDFYRSVLDNMSGIVYNCLNDEEWTMKYISENIVKMTGYPASDFIGNAVRSFNSIVHPDDRDSLARAVQMGIRKRATYTFEYRLLHKNGKTIWVYEIGRGIFDSDNNFLYLSGSIIDITDKKSNEIELKRYRQHLEELVEQRTKEIEEKNKKLQEFNKLFVGREFRIKDLRDQVKQLKEKLLLQEDL